MNLELTVGNATIAVAVKTHYKASFILLVTGREVKTLPSTILLTVPVVPVMSLKLAIMESMINSEVSGEKIPSKLKIPEKFSPVKFSNNFSVSLT